MSEPSTPDFSSVTEEAGSDVSAEQIQRLAHRYYWAGGYCRGKDVIEVACGAGQGLGYIGSLAKSLRAGDITPTLVEKAQHHYGNRFAISKFPAERLPLDDRTLDVIILFEAIYYLTSVDHFLLECRRVLRPGGRVLITTANKDLYDFNPSPFSVKYYGVAELGVLLEGHGFSCFFFGNTPVTQISWRQRALRPVKRTAVRFGLMPKTMNGKKLLKRLVFGKLVPMPPEIDAKTAPYVPPQPIAVGKASRDFKVIYLEAVVPA